MGVGTPTLVDGPFAITGLARLERAAEHKRLTPNTSRHWFSFLTVVSCVAAAKKKVHFSLTCTVCVLQHENRCAQDMEEHKQKLDKEYEQLMQNFTKDLERLRVKHQQELEKKVKQDTHQKKKKKKNIPDFPIIAHTTCDFPPKSVEVCCPT